jgi:hypothetical protein
MKLRMLGENGESKYRGVVACCACNTLLRKADHGWEDEAPSHTLCQNCFELTMADRDNEIIKKPMSEEEIRARLSEQKRIQERKKKQLGA